MRPGCGGLAVPAVGLLALAGLALGLLAGVAHGHRKPGPITAVSFSGGGNRAALGTLAAMAVLAEQRYDVPQMPMSALSGGSWGLALAAFGGNGVGAKAYA